jgi:hypothetical protein
MYINMALLHAGLHTNYTSGELQNSGDTTALVNRNLALFIFSQIQMYFAHLRNFVHKATLQMNLLIQSQSDSDCCAWQS